MTLGGRDTTTDRYLLHGAAAWPCGMRELHQCAHAVRRLHTEHLYWLRHRSIVFTRSRTAFHGWWIESVKRAWCMPARRRSGWSLTTWSAMWQNTNACCEWVSERRRRRSPAAITHTTFMSQNWATQRQLMRAVPWQLMKSATVWEGKKHGAISINAKCGFDWCDDAGGVKWW